MYRSSQQILQVQQRMQKIIRDMERIKNEKQLLSSVVVKDREMINLRKKMLGK